ncbi:D-glycero-D-manno-heptose 1,7-bisphosphate phosphatase [Allocatelliglobosispora scoriae]|uniref:D,D-heptose 1,7-bisphosphate phosphatase n=1 Tax=Allocatelliglobosispora scoriae TaxID=643052 RepID=A0A841BNL3_9ACTN|nr:HAD-IIIA family hydrolase [Allocatelliglobosispora scoriae]MBB5868332.1 D-glycero-D-manno-heptose 1,7-bisphosphate phosphatase [Allocatelliglobosispora scoriae]
MFFDRDGTLNAHVPRDGRRSSPRGTGEWRPLPGGAEAIASLREAGAHIAVVTNQPDLARGLLSWDVLDDLHGQLAGVDAAYTCPHTAAQRCRCRKPSSYWLRRAARELSVSLADSYLVGDRPTDAQAGLNAGLTAVLLVHSARTSGIPGLLYAPDLTSAAAAILRHRSHPQHH